MGIGIKAEYNFSCGTSSVSYIFDIETWNEDDVDEQEGDNDDDMISENHVNNKLKIEITSLEAVAKFNKALKRNKYLQYWWHWYCENAEKRKCGMLDCEESVKINNGVFDYIVIV